MLDWYKISDLHKNPRQYSAKHALLLEAVPLTTQLPVPFVPPLKTFQSGELYALRTQGLGNVRILASANQRACTNQSPPPGTHHSAFRHRPAQSPDAASCWHHGRAIPSSPRPTPTISGRASLCEAKQTTPNRTETSFAMSRSAAIANAGDAVK